MKAYDPNDFKSRFEYSKATSKWHFDKTINENNNPPIKRIGRFIGDWQKDTDYFSTLAGPNTFENRLGKGIDPYTKSLDQEDLKNAGYGIDHVLFDKVGEKNFTFLMMKMRDYFGLEKVNASIHLQRPGQSFPYHIDNLTKLRDNQSENLIDINPDLAIRFVVQLTDWDWGHFWQWGNYMWSQWQAGDIVTHSWRDIPHATANAGHTTRATLQVTGLKTARTEEILNQPYQTIALL